MPVDALQSGDSYDPAFKPEDKIITAKSLERAIAKFNKINFTDGLIIRTIPNDESKKSRKYMEQQPPFFSADAMTLINELGVNHLLVDVPSVDRAFDEGKLTAHHIFWNVEQGSHDIELQNHSLKTITEMIYVPDEVKDGEYMLNLQIAPFVSDASPSRPLLFNIKK